MYDVIIIGGGASGISAAIKAAAGGKKVLIIEKNNKLGKKLYATGNGKCNLTNSNCIITENYFSNDNNYEGFMKEVINTEPSNDVIAFMESLGIKLYEKNGYFYPLSNQASSVVWAMIDKLNQYKVSINLKETVYDLNQESSAITVITDKSSYKAQKIILCCGGKSYEALGGSSLGYDLAKKLNVRLSKIRPSLCPLTTYEKTDAIAGVRTNCLANVINNNKVVASEFGELQITDYGLSGIIIFNLSSIIGSLLENGSKVTISLDLLKDLTIEEIICFINNNNSRTILGCLNGLLNDKLSLYILNSLNIDSKAHLSSLSDKDVYLISKALKDLKFGISGLKGYDQAQVCAGGVALDQINPENLSLFDNPRIKIVGEMLDVDGKCGGYNLTFAILSGMKAGSSIW